MSGLHEIAVGIDVLIIGPGEITIADSESVIEVPLHDSVCAKVTEYRGNDVFRVESLEDGGGHYDVPRNMMIPDTPEYRLAMLVFGAKDIIDIPDPDRQMKGSDEREGRCPTQTENALALLTLSPHTRAVLAIVDPQGLKQADAALSAEGWTKGTEWPEDRLTNRQVALKTIGEILFAAGREMALWQGVQNRPSSHPEYEILRVMGDGAITEFARLNAEMRGLKRASVLDVGRGLGFVESEMFGAEENAADGGE